MPIPVLSSPSLPPQAVAQSGASNRADDDGTGRSFGALLERSRAAAPQGSQDTPLDADLAGHTAGRKSARGGDKKSELTAADVMALLAPLASGASAAAASSRAAGIGGAQPTGSATVAKAAIGQTTDLPPSAATATPGATAPTTTTTTAPTTALPAAASTTPADDAAATTDTPAGKAEALAKAQRSTADAARNESARDDAAQQAPAAAVPAPTAEAALAASATPAPQAPGTAAIPQASAGKPAAPSNTVASASAPAAAVGGTPATGTDKPAGEFGAGTDDRKLPTLPDTAAADSPDAAPNALAALAGAPQSSKAAAASVDRAAAGTNTPVLSVEPPVGSSEWGAAIGRQMIRMSASGHQVAELNLNPTGLGPLKVTLSVADSQAQAQFVSAHESVRKAVEAALPQLRSTLADQGISLGQASVGADTRHAAGQGAGFAQQNPSRSQGEAAYPGSGSGEDTARATPRLDTPAAAQSRSSRALDTFA